MIHYLTGNLLESNAEALVNTVNTDGVMGKGIALQFKNQFPYNFKLYAQACKEGKVKVGKLFVTEDRSLLEGNKIIINFPTKKSWRKPSEYSYIEEGLIDLIQVIEERQIRSVALPPLGAGNGGLNWNNVKTIIKNYLTGIDCDIYVYEPNAMIIETLKKERVKLTPARAILLSLLFDLVQNGEFVSEFSAEKIAYFLQRFGAKSLFNLEYQPNFYGPYSGKVKHVLYVLNGSYITGYSDKDKRPFDVLGLILDAEKEVNEFLDKPENMSLKNIVAKTKDFLSGFYSPYGLELLSTVDFIVTENKANSIEDITSYLEKWSDRKKSMFTNKKFIQIAVENLHAHLV